MLRECKELSWGSLLCFPTITNAHSVYNGCKTKHILQVGCGLFLHSQPPNPGCEPVYEPIQE